MLAAQTAVLDATLARPPPRLAPVADQVAPLNITQLLQMECASVQQDQLSQWVRSVKDYVDATLLGFLQRHKREVSFVLPEKCSMIPPLSITAAASGATLSAFREVMDFDHLEASFSRTGQYEAAGTVWMLDPICPDIDEVAISQLEGCMGLWTEEAYIRSSDHVPSRRLSFDVPLPVKVVDRRVVQRLEPGKP